MKKLLMLLLIVFLCSCSAQQISENYQGATEQRLLSHSINDLAEALPEADFELLEGKIVFLECHFLNDIKPVELESHYLNNIKPVEYAKQRLVLELINTYNCHIVTQQSDAEITLQIFFTALGTDLDKFGLSLPDLVVPGAGVVSSIDIIALEKFHGVAEMYYYFLDENNHIIAKGKPLKTITRNDSLNLPIISIPINTVD